MFVFNHTIIFKVPKDVSLRIPSKRELQQIAINHSSDIDFKEFMEIYKKCLAERYCFLVNDTTLPSNNLLRFRKNLLEWMHNKIMTIDNKLKKYNTILIKKLQKYQPYQQAKLINTNIKYPNILIHHLEKPFKKKTKSKEKNKAKQLKSMENN